VIKCVIWDIDNTLLAGTYLEAAGPPPAPDPGLLAVARELDSRGIVHALASKNPPEAADYVARATGLTFAAAECGWGRKSEAISRIIDDLGLAADAVAFVDDDLLERAEVAAALPGVLVLTPEDAAEAASWPEFSPAVITAEGRRRGEMYAQRRLRQEEARAFGGSRDDFLAYAGTEVLIALAGPADLPRLHELSVRTHQFNTGTEPVAPDRLAAALADGQQRLVAVWLRDRFGDDGLVGGALVEEALVEEALVEEALVEAGWTVSLLVMSCRALGRGVLDALLAALCQQVAAGGAAELRVPCLVTDRNVPLRLALAAAGFRAAEDPEPPAPPDPAPALAAASDPAPVVPGSGSSGSSTGGGSASGGRSAPRLVIFTRSLAGSLPALPAWATVRDLT
jgi:methoxymalonate biosynthesis protein